MTLRNYSPKGTRFLNLQTVVISVHEWFHKVLFKSLPTAGHLQQYLNPPRTLKRITTRREVEEIVPSKLGEKYTTW